MPTIAVNDIELYYEEHGSGEPLILISGISADHTPWEVVVEMFAQKFRVITFDNRGCGQSTCPNQLYTIDMMSDDVVGLCAKLGITSAHFVGNSMGGVIVQNLAYKYPQLTRSAIICNSLAKVTSRAQLQIEAHIALLEAGVSPQIIAKSVLPWLFSKKYLAQAGVADKFIKNALLNKYPITATGFRNQMNAIKTFDSTSWLHKITSSCLIIYAADDLFADLASSHFLVGAIPGCESYCFYDVGHLPHVEQPEEFVRQVQKFIF